MKTNLKTNYSKSPVIVITNKNGSTRNCAIDYSGNIYRIVKFSERNQISTVEEFEVDLSEKTLELISDFQNNCNDGWIDKLQVVRDYNLMFNYGSSESSPLFEMDEKMYYPAYKAIELQKQIEQLQKGKNELQTQISMYATALSEITTKKRDVILKERTARIAKAEKEAKKLTDKKASDLLKSLIKHFGKDAKFATVYQQDWERSRKHLRHVGETSYNGKVISDGTFTAIETITGQIYKAKKAKYLN